MSSEGNRGLNEAVFSKAMLTVDEIARTYDGDPEHNEQVTALALRIFDDLKPLHEMGTKERQLLEIAGRMHDIGWSRTVLTKHHKLSRDMILETKLPGISSSGKLICALVAQYHTKALPDASRHQMFASLSAKNRNIVEWLAAMLRVADALDSSHTSVVSKLDLHLSKKTITFHLGTTADCWDEIRRARRKESLLIKKSKKGIVYQC